MVGLTRWRTLLRIEAVGAQKNRCIYCYAPITQRTATADHKWPISRRGRTDRENIVAACRPCNQTKANRSHIEFYRLIDRRLPKGAPVDILLIWASRRIWRRTHRACDRIGKFGGLS